jgi:hypothetical protein
MLTSFCTAATAATAHQTLPYSLKTGDSEDQAVLTRITSILAARIRDSVRLNTKAVEAAATNTRLPTGASPAAIAALAAAAVVAESEVQRGTELANWLCTVLLDGLYPGAPFAREVLVAQLLGVLSAALAPPHPLSAVVAAALTAPSATVALLNLLISSWDRSRQLAAALLARFPPPLALLPTPSNNSSSTSSSDSSVPSINGTISSNSSSTNGSADSSSSSSSNNNNKGVGSGLRLVRWGLLMTRSPRQRESDAGALILRLVLRSHAAGTGWCVPLAAVDAAAEGAYSVDTSSTSGSSALCFAATAATAAANGRDQRPVQRSSGEVQGEVQGEFGTPGPLGTGALSFVQGLCDVLAARLQGVAAAYAALANGDDVAAELAAAKSSLSALHLGAATPRTTTATSSTDSTAEATAQGLSLAHGVLAALHYAVAEVPWAQAVASPCCAADWRRVAVNILTGVQVRVLLY